LPRHVISDAWTILIDNPSQRRRESLTGSVIQTQVAKP
jgi:hypothetical protein